MLYDASNGENSLVGEITSLGEIATSSSELLLVFRSDCEVTNKGFQANIEFNERIVSKTVYVPNTKVSTESNPGFK